MKAKVETGIDLRKKVDLDTAILTKLDITDRKKVKENDLHCNVGQIVKHAIRPGLFFGLIRGKESIQI